MNKVLVSDGVGGFRELVVPDVTKKYILTHTPEDGVSWSEVKTNECPAPE